VHPLDEQGLCGLCRRELTGFDAAYSFGSYENELRQLIHVFKYGGVQTLARPLGKLLMTALPRERNFDVIVPMPLHWTKRWTRGFNQAELLARELSRFAHVPLRRLVRRVRVTSVQAGLTAAKRRANVASAFRANGAVRGKKILLVDDVMTTGATGGACALALKKAGAAHVTLLTLARVDRRLASVTAQDTDFSSQWSALGSFENAESRPTT
jgi:ComF family protein